MSGESTAIAAKPHEPAYAEPEGRSVEVGAACDGLDHESSDCIGLLCGGHYCDQSMHES